MIRAAKPPTRPLFGTVDKDALRVCVDLEYRAGYTEGKTPENAFYNLMNTVKSLGGPENVSFEYLPREGTERETALDRVRTEIMSGGGRICSSSPATAASITWQQTSKRCSVCPKKRWKPGFSCRSMTTSKTRSSWSGIS